MTESGGRGEATGAVPAAPQALPAHSGAAVVFISYASQDAAVADAVVGALERAGLKCWIAPRDVVPGALYADEIVRALFDRPARDGQSRANSEGCFLLRPGPSRAAVS